MTEVHTTEVTLDEWSSGKLAEILYNRGFHHAGGKPVGEVDYKLGKYKVEITQTITEEPKEVLLEAEKEFRKEVEVEKVADYQGKPVGLGSNTEEAVEKLKAGKGLVGQVQAQLWAGGNKDVFREAGWEIGKEPKIGRIEGIEYISNMEAELIARGAKHESGRLVGVVGYDFQDGYVLVVQTVLVEG